MTATKYSDPAFPVPMFAIGHAKYESEHRGLSLRDYLAARAMQGMLANPDCDLGPLTEIPGAAYEMADAMLKARAR